MTAISVQWASPYAIKIPFDDSFMYITENGDGCTVKTFNTYEEAEKHAETWKRYEIVQYKQYP